MTQLDPSVDYANMSDVDILYIGLDAAVDGFQRDVAAGLTNNDSLAIAIGYIDDDGSPVLQGCRIGPDAAEFEVNIDPETGKLATALKYEMNSIDAYALNGDEIPEGPQRWTGAVYYKARVQTADGWKIRLFVGAASGVQGHLDQATVYTGITHSAAAWAQQMVALYGKPE